VEEIRDSSLLVFIDANASPTELWSLRKLKPRRIKLFAASKFLPEEILLLLDELYEKKVEGWVLSVKGSDFSFGAGLTQATRKLAEEAEKLLKSFLEVNIACMSSH